MSIGFRRGPSRVWSGGPCFFGAGIAAILQSVTASVFARPESAVANNPLATIRITPAQPDQGRVSSHSRMPKALEKTTVL